MGYDHIDENDKVLMREKEESVLEKLGISRDVTFVTQGEND